MVNSNSKKDCVHDLANDKLDNLILELLSMYNDDNDPACHVESVGDDKVP